MMDPTPAAKAPEWRVESGGSGPVKVKHRARHLFGGADGMVTCLDLTVVTQAIMVVLVHKPRVCE